MGITHPITGYGATLCLTIPPLGNGFVLHNRRFCSTLLGMGIKWTQSADKHEVDRADALNAIHNAYYVEDEFDDSRVPGQVKPTLYIGPPLRPGGPLLEVMVNIIPPSDVVIFHVMEAQERNLERMDD